MGRLSTSNNINERFGSILHIANDYPTQNYLVRYQIFVIIWYVEPFLLLCITFPDT